MRAQIAGSTSPDIASSVEAAVRAGQLGPGEPLPPVRRLAGDLGVSPATVAAAYRELKQRAVIETAGRAGTRVRERPAIASRTARRLAVPPGGRDLAEGGPDRRLLPDLTVALGRLAQADWTASGGYDVAGPSPELVDLARERLAADRVPIEGAGITVTSGALDGIERALTAHLAPGDRVAVEDPGWANLFDLLATLRLTPIPVPMDDDGPTEAGLGRALRSGVRAVVVTSRAQNPTGAAVSAARAEALRGLLAGHPAVLVIEDDHAAELAEVPLAPVAGAVGAANPWAFVRSVSKPYGPDLRLAVLAGDEATVSRVAGRHRLGAGWVSTLLQRVVVELWRDPEVGRLIGRARRSYARRRDGLRDALAARDVRSSGRTGINVWVPVTDETTTVARLRDAGWVVAPGSAYRIAAGPAVRITVSSLDTGDLDPLAEAVARARSVPSLRYGA